MIVPGMLLSALLALTGDSPPPLTDEQTAKIQQLVRTTQAEMTRLRGLLDQKQRELGRHYAEFDLNADAVQKLQAEVVELQKQLLTSYHAMHVELRKIVGRERFVTLRQRIDNILNPPMKEK